MHSNLVECAVFGAPASCDKMLSALRQRADRLEYRAMRDVEYHAARNGELSSAHSVRVELRFDHCQCKVN